ncbi:hypothetical protein [Leptolyngbya sp. NIES-2104]|uniref:hypothetical protein n=1 Tax=Leptolyngbya sp. NIES-2104 TaxID=1552121 RepID=UPI0006ECA782|nr:hypothetical protein [Leptolyngbya sp. NIES-2104]GAP97643.1 hypothetical protein NIES2104_41900 [Leptolyngbya sp. NIES-2104]
MKRTILSLAVAMFSISPVIPAIAQAPRPAELPAQGGTLQSLVPKGWKVESTTQGDLNGDRKPDAVLRLIKTSGEDRDRALLVLQQQSNGQWQRIGFAPNILLCSTCGGMLGSIQIKIENGVILVDQLRGSREAVNTLHRFWIDKASNRIVLIGLDVNVRDRATGDETRESSNFLTGQKITEKYRPNQQRTGIELVSRQRSTIPKTTRAIETVNIAETQL